MFEAGAPPPDVVVPPVVVEVAGDRDVRPVWRNELGGLTFAVGTDLFVKWSPPGGPDLGAERERLGWAALYTPVPRVLDFGDDWLLTEALPGDSAVAPRWLDAPRQAVIAIGQGLRAMHDDMPVGQCPFDWSAQRRTEVALARGRRDPADWWPVHRSLDPDEAFARLRDPPPLDRLVVCHGDACTPNTIIGADGRWIGHVDLGELGVADRWADLAIATWSLEWNYEPGWDAVLLDAYGIDADPVRTAYYRLLWDLSP